MAGHPECVSGFSIYVSTLWYLPCYNNTCRCTKETLDMDTAAGTITVSLTYIMHALTFGYGFRGG